MSESVEARLDSLKSELIAAGDVARRLTEMQEAIHLITGVLEDLINERDDSQEYDEDLVRLRQIARSV